MQIIRQEGSMSLLRGLGPNVGRAVLMNTSQLATSVCSSQRVLREFTIYLQIRFLQAISYWHRLFQR